MTAVISILNKTAVAIAADSAVTVTGVHKKGQNGRKVYNTANKIFELSKYQPIGLVIYNSANFYKTPWETIIKMFREDLANGKNDTLIEYQQAFISYLKQHSEFYSQVSQQRSLHSLTNALVDEALGEAEDKLPDDFSTKSAGDQLSILLTVLEETVNDDIHLCDNRPTQMNEFDNFLEADLLSVPGCDVHNIVETRLQEYDVTSLTSLFVTYIHRYVKSGQFYLSNHTGLVFVGFGSKEIYPNSVAVEVGEMIAGKLRYRIENQTQITDDNSAAILPYAQRDVIDTIIRGVAPDLKQVYNKTFVDLLEKYNDTIASVFESIGVQAIADQIRGIDAKDYVDEFIGKINDYQIEEYTLPTVMTTALLSKEDLAEMAESLIYLTYLKRRFTSQEESVGGPVDVAVISKGDGFVWIKRKHYFKAELNPHFFHTYFHEQQ